MGWGGGWGGYGVGWKLPGIGDVWGGDGTRWDEIMVHTDRAIGVYIADRTISVNH